VSVSHAVIDVVTKTAGQAVLGRVATLAAVFAQVKDPRKAKGVRHPLAAVLTVLTMALLCGARDFRQAADRVAELPQSVLDAAGARRHPILGIRIPPARDTLRRLAQTVDAAVMDRLICTWLTTLLDEHAGSGLALDGKTVRNTRPGTSTGLDVQLFSAMRHDTAVVVAQVKVPADTTEVTQIAALLDGLDITGMTITADAAHPQPRHRRIPAATPGRLRLHRQRQQARTAHRDRRAAPRRSTGHRRSDTHRAPQRPPDHPYHLDRTSRRHRLPRRRPGLPDPP